MADEVVQNDLEKIDVRYVANLARLYLDDSEVETFQGQMEGIVQYVKQIGELDLSGIEPTSHARPVQNVLREEVKEKLKWSVDRSSPSNKIRDLMMWCKVILKDIHYQKRILSYFIAAFLT